MKKNESNQIIEEMIALRSDHLNELKQELMIYFNNPIAKSRKENLFELDDFLQQLSQKYYDLDKSPNNKFCKADIVAEVNKSDCEDLSDRIMEFDRLENEIISIYTDFDLLGTCISNIGRDLPTSNS